MIEALSVWYIALGVLVLIMMGAIIATEFPKYKNIQKLHFRNVLTSI